MFRDADGKVTSRKKAVERGKATALDHADAIGCACEVVVADHDPALKVTSGEWDVFVERYIYAAVGFEAALRVNLWRRERGHVACARDVACVREVPCDAGAVSAVVRSLLDYAEGRSQARPPRDVCYREWIVMLDV